MISVAHFGGVSMPTMATMSKQDAFYLKNVRHISTHAKNAALNHNIDDQCTGIPLHFRDNHHQVVCAVYVSPYFHSQRNLVPHWLVGKLPTDFSCYTVTSVTLTAWQIVSSKEVWCEQHQ
jgi:hypothetical protein